MNKLNPCGADCPRRTVGCRANCPDWTAAQEEKGRIRAARDKDLLIRGYMKDSVWRNKRRNKRRSRR